MTPDRCATIAAHAARVLAPATMHAADVLIVRLRAEGHPITATPAQLARRVQACGVALDHVQRGLPDAVLSLAAQRECAAGGRPRTGQSSGSSSSSGPSRPTEDIATELLRIRLVGLTLVEAIDRLHPDPLWPPLASGGRGRTQTATECLTAACGASHGTLSPAQAWDDLLDALDGVEIATNLVRTSLARALKVRAWGGQPAHVDPPPLDSLVRCNGWPRGRDANGELVGCSNYRGDVYQDGTQGHAHPETGKPHHGDLCDECYRLVCPACWHRPRRTAGAATCSACESSERRLRRAA